MAINKAKIITVTSVKGGTGKTTTVLNLAGLLALSKIKTVIVDLDLYSGAVAASLNVKTSNNVFTCTNDIMNNRFKQIEDYVASYNDYIDVIAAPNDPRSSNKISPKYIEILINRLSLQYEVILIDTNHSIDKTNLTAFDISDMVLYVISSDLMDIKNMRTISAIYNDMGVKTYRILLNDALPNKSHYSIYDISNMLDADINYVLPKSFYNKNIAKDVEKGKIMTLEKGFSKSKGSLILEEILKEMR